MYGGLKSTFGTPANQPSFGFSNNANPFGQSTFGKTNTMGFGAPAFGATSAPLFGSTTQHGSLFGGATQNASSFGQPTAAQPAFGSSMFGQTANQPSGSGLFGSPSATAFGQQAKPTGFGFRSSSNDTFFKQPNAQVQQQQPNAGIFVQNPSTLFGSPTAFGNTNPAGQMGTIIKFNPVTGTDTMVKGNINQTINTRHHCITCMKEYESKSLEELRWEDYQANRKGPQQGVQTAPGMFGAVGMAQPVAAPGLFGAAAPNTAVQQGTMFGQAENKSVFGSGPAVHPTPAGFGQTNAVFGQPAQPNASNLFAKPMGFATNTMATSAFPMASAQQLQQQQLQQQQQQQQQQPNLFGANTGVKTFGVVNQQPNLFGQQQQATGFGGQAAFGAFGQQNAQQNMNLFNQNKTTPFNMGQAAPTNTGFGGFGQAAAVQNTNLNLFSANKPINTGFAGFGGTATASATPVFGQIGFGAQPTNTSLFSTTFKPQNTLFGQNPVNQQMGMGMNPVNTMQPVFGNTAMKPGTMFGTNPGMFNTGFTNIPFNAYNMTNMTPQTGTTTADASHMTSQEKIIAMTAMPFGSSPHLNNIPELEHDLKDLTRPTNPAELSRILNTTGSKSPVTNMEKLQPIQLLGRKPMFQQPMFNGLEQNDETIVSNFHMVSNPKRLVIRKTAEPEEPEILTEVTDVSTNTPIVVTTPFHLCGRSLDSYLKDSSTSLEPDLTADKENKEGKEKDTSETEKEKNKDKEQTDSVIIEEDEDDNDAFLEASETQDWHEEYLNQSKKTLEENATEQLEPEVEEPKKKGPNSTSIIVSTRSDYYTVPTQEELVNYIDEEDGSCIVQGFTVGRVGYGSVYFPDPLDVSGLNLDELVHFRSKEITIYPDEKNKPPHGQGLNRRAQVTLDRMFPYDRERKITVTDPETIAELEYSESLRRVCERQETRFVEYRPDTGSWVFKVDHFSRYGYRDSDEDEDSDRGDDAAAPPSATAPPASAASASAASTATKAATLEAKVADEGTSSEPSTSGLNNTHSKLSLMKLTFFPSDQEEPQPDTSLEISETRKKMEEMYRYINLQSPDAPTTDNRPRPLAETNSELVNDKKVEAIKNYPHPQRVRIIAYNGTVPRGLSMLNEKNIADFTVFKGRSFKIGWGKDLTLLCLTTVNGMETKGLIGNLFEGRTSNDYSKSVVQRVQLNEIPHKNTDFNLHILETHMDSQLVNSEYTVINETPHFQPIKGTSMLEGHDDVASAVVSLNRNKSCMHSYCYLIWKLCVALWGDLRNEDTHNYPESELRRLLFSNWLENLTKDIVEIHLDDNFVCDEPTIVYNLLTHVSGFKLVDATDYAFENNFYNLAMLLSEFPGSEYSKYFLEQQLIMWFESTSHTKIDANVIRLYMIGAGRPHVHYDETYIFACEELDWMRTMAMYFWYFTPQSAPISQAINMYEEAFTSSNSINQPHPVYDDKLEHLRDLIFHILKFYSDLTYPLAPALNPITYTKDPTDYSLCWLLSQTFDALEINNMSEHSILHIHMNYVTQLERIGLWHWAIFVLLFLKNQDLKRSMIMELLYRHTETMDDGLSKEYLKREKMIVNSFHVPSIWVDSVKATKALIRHEYKEAVHYMCYSEQWNQAHKLIIEYYFPDHFLCHDYEHLLNLLTPLEKVTQRVVDWQNRGGLVLEFTRLNCHYKELIDSEDPDKIQEQLSQFDGKIQRLSNRVKKFPRLNYLHNICLAEMSSRLAMMLRHMAFAMEKYREERLMSKEMRRLLNFPLPGDYLQREMSKILAEYYRRSPHCIDKKFYADSPGVMTGECNMS